MAHCCVSAPEWKRLGFYSRVCLWLKWLFQRYDELYDWPHSAGHSTGALGRSHSLAWPTSKQASERFIKVISGSHSVIKMDVERRGNHTRFIFSQGRFPLVAQFHQSAV
jgi:hypothetical protein